MLLIFIHSNLLNLNIDQVNEICQNAYHKIDGNALANITKVLEGFIDE